MAAPKGNKYWEFRDKHGRDKKYTPDDLWSEFVQYMSWLEDNPLYEARPFSFQGVITIAKVAKMRAPTISGFCIYADITPNTLTAYKNDEDFISIITRIEESIKTIKFEGAAAELINPNLIAREMGLREGLDHTTKGESINTPKTLDDWYNPHRGEE